VNPDIKARWVTALRSGHYKQGRTALRFHGKYCCLGVLCDLYPNSNKLWKLSTDVHDIGDEFDGYAELLPEYVVEWAGLDEVDPKITLSNGEMRSLVYVNDELKYDFNTIADIIEEQL
jgi:hypothetical protein